MRKIILTLATGLAIVTAGAKPASAAESPWCSEFDAFTKNCTYASHDECAAAIRGFEARCIQNPNYQPPAAQAARHKAASSKTSSKQR